MIEIKKDGKTIFRLVPDNYKEEKKSDGFKPSAGDITCSNAKSVALGFSEEDYNRIFRK